MSISNALLALMQAHKNIAAAIRARGGPLPKDGGFSDYAAAIDAIPADRPPNYEAAILSDVHIGAYGSDADSTCRVKWANALNWTHGWADFTVVCGDTTYAGSTAEFDSYVALRDEFRQKPVHTITGNHDTKGGATARNSIRTALQATETAFGATVQDSAGWMFRHGEDLYIGLHEYSETAEGLFVPGALDWLQTVLEENRNRRCFLFFHLYDDADNVAGNASGQYNAATDIWYENSAECRRFTAMLRHYRNVIWFHGHTHTTFAYQTINGVWQDKANIDTRDGFRNVHISSVGYPRAKAGNSYQWLNGESQGYRMAVYDTYIRLQAVELITGETLYSYAIDTTPCLVEANTFDDPTDTPVPATGVTLSATSLKLPLNDPATLTATVTPSNAANRTVTWASSNTAIATVANGVVTLTGAGTAIITATTADGQHSATCTVTDVYGEITELEGLTWYNGVTASSSGGTIAASTSHAVTNLVRLSGSTGLRVTTHDYPGGRVHFYDVQKHWLSCSPSLSQAGGQSVSAPEGAMYFRLRGYYNDHYDVTLVTEGDAGAATAYTDVTDIDHYAWFDGYSPKTDTGVWRAKAGDAATNYISVGAATVLTVTVTATPGGCVHYYDASRNWIGHDDGTGLSTNGTKNMHVGTHALPLPENAAYFVVTGYSETGGHYTFTLASE